MDNDNTTQDDGQRLQDEQAPKPDPQAWAKQAIRELERDARRQGFEAAIRTLQSYIEREHVYELVTWGRPVPVVLMA
jgi:hypothetical protein